jgi:hypothetical protein
MKKIVLIFISFALASCIFSGCSKDKFPLFQDNNASAPFNLYHLFDDYPALKYAWDSVPGGTGNQKMAEMMQSDIPGTTEFLSIMSYLLLKADNPGLGLLNHLKAALNLLVDENERFYNNSDIDSFYAKDDPSVMMRNFYGFLDELARDVGGTTPKVHDSVTAMMNRVLPYLLDEKTEDEIQEFIEKLYMPMFYPDINYGGTGVRAKEGSYSLPIPGIDDKSISSIKVQFGYKVTLYSNNDYTGSSWVLDSNETDLDIKGCDNAASSLKIEKDPDSLADLADIAAQPLVMGDYPMYVTEGATPAQDTLITDYSAMTGGVDSGLGNMSQGLRDLMYGIITLFNGETVDRAFMYKQLDSLYNSLNDPETINMLVWNMSNYFTAGGSYYGAAEDTSNTEVYPSDMKLRYSTNSANLYSNAEFRETMRETLAAMSGLLMRDDRRSSDTWYDGTTSKEYPLASFLKNVKKLYINWDNAQIKESIYDMIRYDMYGRDRRTNINAFATSMLEHLLFLNAVAGNFGYECKKDSNEVGVNNSPGDGYYTVSQSSYGHGKHTGYLTLNDALFSIQLRYEPTIALLTYEIAFDAAEHPNDVPINSPYGDKMIYRGTNQFDLTELNDYQFTISANYPVLKCLNGPSAGDYGVPDGGGPGATATDAYTPYSANGKGMMDLASWSFGHVIRACWEGEGPYYSTQGAQQNEDGTFTYYRPDGTVYAKVDKTDPSNPIYTYPVSSDYDKEDPKKPGQRWNRYKESWNTDYYIIKTKYINGDSGIPEPPNEEHYWVPRDVAGERKATSVGMFNQFKGTTTAGSTFITVNNKFLISVGSSVSDSNGYIPAGTTVSSTGGTNNFYITISSPATGSGDTMLTFIPKHCMANLKGNITSGSGGNTIIAGLQSTSSLNPGMEVKGTGIPANTVISSVDSSSQITISQSAPSADNVILTFYLPKITGITTSGSKQITGMSGTSSLGTDMIVIGANIPANSHIESIDSKTQITISQAATNTSTGPIDLAFAFDSSASRTYDEIIREKSADRECSSFEEALFRNFQWVMNEKKMVLIVPLYLALRQPVTSFTAESAAYQIIEGNGITGLSTARRYRGNGVWAKANFGNSSDASCRYDQTSRIPGDYRMTVIASPTLCGMAGWTPSVTPLIGDAKIYNSLDSKGTIGRGSATPGIIAHNIYALSRLGFPRSNNVTSGTDYKHCLLGSQKVDNDDAGGTDLGFLTTNPVWSKRNSLLPMLIALMAPLREKSYYESATVYNNALAKMLEGLKFLIKPMVYYNNNSTFTYEDELNPGTYLTSTGVAQNCWLPRIMGRRSFSADVWAVSPENPYQATYASSLMSDWNIDGFEKSTTDPTGWYGGNTVRKYYRPEEVPTMLSILIDSDTSLLRNEKTFRADGLLSRMVEYDNDPSTVEPERPPADETPLEYKEPNMTAINAICAGLEQLTSGIKGQPARGTQIDNMLTTQLSPIGTQVKQLAVPQWRFEHRVRPDDPSKWVDINLDKMLNKIKGGDDGNDSTKGLNRLHDASGYYGDEADDPNFTDIADLVSDLSDLMNKFMLKDGYKGGIYSISENLFDILDVMAQHSVSPEQVKGLQYALGKMLAYYEVRA